jgi:hypothetical protein
VSDIFREVEEEVRKERLDKIWKEYGDYIVAGACLIVIGAAGLQLWRTYDHNQRLKASDQYTAAQAMIDGGQTAPAADAFGRLADSAPSGYKELARLQHADALMASGERGDALNLYKQIGAGSDPLLAAVARLHAAWATADYAPRADVVTTLGSLDDAGNPWRPLAQEVLAYWDYHSGNTKAALAEYDALTKLGATAPSGLKERAKVMADFLKAGGGANFGTVPQPPKPAESPLPADSTAPNPNGAPNPAAPNPGHP